MNTILMSLIMMTMTYEMPKLPYANNALEPVISQQTIDFHYIIRKSKCSRVSK